MTDILDRPTIAEPLIELERAPGSGDSPSVAVRTLLAVLCGAAAAIHFAMAPAHAAEWRVEGVAFVASAWIQAVLAIALAVRPSRRWLTAAVVCNLAFIGAWAFSRTAGLPSGPNAGVVEAVTSVDLTCVVLEGLIVAVAIAALL
ncbi:MAG TPA: hypothetical protein VIJ47_06585, partial [Acidimicrobiales bacterium]